jgi:asparagine synthase (glutamine-hydrolysing)
LSEETKVIAQELYRKLDGAIERRIKTNLAGSWLSGGLDSSVIVSIVRPKVSKMYTFSVGIEGAPDLYYAREVAKFVRSEHKELVVSLEDMLKVLPQGYLSFRILRRSFGSFQRY